ncbi:MAG TPA: hypothetical protein VG186_14970 [Solirubrobacteraceae bacterium]|nr:hypothetical protein [Solirubrobacteraceae bacterium]
MIVVLLGAVAAVALPAPALAAGVPRPAAGKWKITGGGGFTVSSNEKLVSGLHLKPGSSSGCGTAPISVLGTHKLTTASRGGYTSWILGKNTPKTSSGVSTVRVKVRQAGTTTTGAIDIIFAIAGNTTRNDGLLEFGSCALSFYATR